MITPLLLGSILLTIIGTVGVLYGYFSISLTAFKNFVDSVFMVIGMLFILIGIFGIIYQLYCI